MQRKTIEQIKKEYLQSVGFRTHFDLNVLPLNHVNGIIERALDQERELAVREVLMLEGYEEPLLTKRVEMVILILSKIG